MRKESTYYCPNFCGVERTEQMVCPECGIELVGVGGEERESEDEETFPKTQSDFDEDPTMATWGDEGEGDLSLI